MASSSAVNDTVSKTQDWCAWRTALGIIIWPWYTPIHTHVQAHAHKHTHTYHRHHHHQCDFSLTFCKCMVKPIGLLNNSGDTKVKIIVHSLMVPKTSYASLVGCRECKMWPHIHVTRAKQALSLNPRESLCLPLSPALRTPSHLSPVTFPYSIFFFPLEVKDKDSNAAPSGV